MPVAKLGTAPEKRPRLPLMAGGETRFELLVIEAPVALSALTNAGGVTEFAETPWYVIRMPGGVGGGSRKASPYPDWPMRAICFFILMCGACEQVWAADTSALSITMGDSREIIAPEGSATAGSKWI